MALSHSLGMIGLFYDISSILARQGVMVSPPSFGISPENPSGPTDFFLLIFG